MPLIQLLGRITRMEDSNTKLVIGLTLWTVGVVLILLGIDWLMFLGLALTTLSIFFSSQKSDDRTLVSFLITIALAFGFLILDSRDGVAFTQKTYPLWLWIAMVGLWVGGIIEESRKRPKSGNSHDA